MHYKVAVVGASGIVGRQMLQVLQQRGFPAREVVALASSRSAGQYMPFGQQQLCIMNLEEYDFAGTDIALFSAGSAVSAKYASEAAAKGCVVIDNSSHFRMHEDVPLIVPEVNGSSLNAFVKRRIIANPNCAVAQLVMVLKSLHDAATIKRVVLSTYQSVSGAGNEALQELQQQSTAHSQNKPCAAVVFKKQIAFNLLPQIDSFLANGNTKEEQKIIDEVKKILDPAIAVSATCVRVPVIYGHSESVNIEFQQPLTAAQARAILHGAPGVVVWDNDPADYNYITPLECAGTDAVYVSRIRQDASIKNALNMWVVSDNLRKGAALNAVQIAEELVNHAYFNN